MLLGGGRAENSATDRTTPKIEDELHVNLWEDGSEPVLDLGLMIHDWTKLDAIQVDLPWKVEPKDVSDLGVRLNSEKAVAAVFNEVVEYSGRADQSYASISFHQHRQIGTERGKEALKEFTLLRLSSKAFRTNHSVAADRTTSTQLRVAIPKALPLSAGDKTPQCIYVRFRIRGVPKAVYASEFKQQDRNLLSSSTETRIIDFRINVRRGVPDEVLSADEGVAFPNFKKIHFFLTVHRSEICEFQSQSFVGCRSLVDEDEWAEYIRDKSSAGFLRQNSMRDYLGYQWTAKADAESSKPRRGVKDLLVLGRFYRHRSSFLYIIRFLILGVVFGMIGNGLWDVVKPEDNLDIVDRVGKHVDAIAVMSAFLTGAFFIVFLDKMLNMPRVCFYILRKIFLRN